MADNTLVAPDQLVQNQPVEVERQLQRSDMLCELRRSINVEDYNLICEIRKELGTVGIISEVRFKENISQVFELSKEKTDEIFALMMVQDDFGTNDFGTGEFVEKIDRESKDREKRRIAKIYKLEIDPDTGEEAFKFANKCAKFAVFEKPEDDQGVMRISQGDFFDEKFDITKEIEKINNSQIPDEAKAIQREALLGLNFEIQSETLFPITPIIEYLEQQSSEYPNQTFGFLVMNYTEGGDLYSFIKKLREKHLKKGSLEEIFEDTCNVLIGLTNIANAVDKNFDPNSPETNVIMRDLKPTNILLDGEIRIRSYLTDFGVAILGSEQPQYPIGTYKYKAPETMNSTPEESHGGEIYAFNAIVGNIFGTHDRFVSIEGATKKDKKDSVSMSAYVIDKKLRDGDTVLTFSEELNRDIWILIGEREITNAIFDLVNTGSAFRRNDRYTHCTSSIGLITGLLDTTIIIKNNVGHRFENSEEIVTVAERNKRLLLDLAKIATGRFEFTHETDRRTDIIEYLNYNHGIALQGANLKNIAQYFGINYGNTQITDAAIVNQIVDLVALKYDGTYRTEPIIALQLYDQRVQEEHRALAENQKRFQPLKALGSLWKRLGGRRVE